MNVTSKQVMVYKFEFSQDELLSAGGLESEWYDYMLRQALMYLNYEWLKKGGETSHYFSHDERPSTLTITI